MLFPRLITLYLITHFVRGYFIITNFTQCDKPMEYVNFDCKIPKTGYQSCNIIHKSTLKDGENFRFDATFEMLRGKRWRKLVNIKEERGMCRAMELYAKDVFYNALESANEPKQCPLRNGTIRVKNLKLDASTFQIVALPKGKLRMHVKTYEKSSGKLGICADLEVDSL